MSRFGGFFCFFFGGGGGLPQRRCPLARPETTKKLIPFEISILIRGLNFSAGFEFYVRSFPVHSFEAVDLTSIYWKKICTE